MQKDNPIESLDINNSEEINKQSLMELYFLNKSNNKTEKIGENNTIFYFFDSKNKSQFVFNLSNKNDISEDKKEHINQVIFQSHNFLRPFSSFNSKLFQHINNEYKLINFDIFSSSIIPKSLINEKNKENDTNSLKEDIYSNLLYLNNLYEKNNNNNEQI